MDYKFLHKVVDQIVSETRIDYEKEEIQFPFSSRPFSLRRPRFLPHHFPFSSSPPSLPIFSFSDHCKDVYGLNEEETMYVWKEYREIIKDKIENNG